MWRQGVAGVSGHRAPHMTRRGTLAYYLAAWVIGCFVVAVLQWIADAFAGSMGTASALLITYFFSLVFGAVTILLFAFLLRRCMRLMKAGSLWIWVVSGAALAFVLIIALIHAQNALLSMRSGQFGELFFGLILKAVDSLSGHNLWQAPVAGATTAAVLGLVDRAFAPQNHAPEPNKSPA